MGLLQNGEFGEKWVCNGHWLSVGGEIMPFGMAF
jgi:hypothetical protein